MSLLLEKNLMKGRYADYFANIATIDDQENLLGLTGAEEVLSLRTSLGQERQKSLQSKCTHTGYAF